MDSYTQSVLELDTENDCALARLLNANNFTEDGAQAA
jgi:hypothetical protein